MALGIGYGLPFVAQHGTNPYKTQWAAALEGAKGAGASVEDENAGTGSCLVSRGQDVYTDGLPFTPSLLIVPQFYKEGNLYQDVPPFVAEDSTMRFTVSRNTTATRVNSSGFIESVASGVPRIDWLGQSCPGLLVEASGQNLALQSENFTTTWTRVSGGTGLLPVITPNAVVAPDGTTTADTVVFDRNAVSGSANLSQLQQDINFPTSGTYTFGVYAKATTSGDVGKQFYIRTRNILVSGSLTSSWVRYTSTETGLSSGVNTVFIGNRGGFTADQTVSVDLWGAQLEAGSIATTYIPTTTTTASRAADVISASGALVSGLIGQTEGTIYAEVDISKINTNSILSLNDGTGTNRFIIQFFSSTVLLADIRVAGVNANFSVTIPAIPANGGIYKVALGYKANDYCFALNGTTYASTSSRGVPATTQINLGNYLSSLQLNDRIRSAALYTTRLSNDQLAELTRL